MKAVIQRVSKAQVEVEKEIVGKISDGFLVLLGIHKDDQEKQAIWLAEKICRLRVFSDEKGKMNLDIKQKKGQILVVSQFTLYGNLSSGNRPDFLSAAKKEIAIPLYQVFIECIKKEDVLVEKGVFGAHMKIDLCNDGPVTMILET